MAASPTAAKGLVADPVKAGSSDGLSSRSHDSISQKDLKAFPSLDSRTAIEIDEGKLTWGTFKKDFFKQPGEGWGRYAVRWATESHTVPDAFLTSAAAPIGQVLLACPNALYKAGLISGSIMMFIAMILAFWTMFILSALYLERKKTKLEDGTWRDHDRHVTQYHEVIGHHLGRPWQIMVQVLLALSLFGTGIKQVVACASDMYYIMPDQSKRKLSLIWGGVLMVFLLFPTFRHLRLLNIVALFGTTFTAIYIMAGAVQHGFKDKDLANFWPIWNPKHTEPPVQRFFTGSAVLISSVGGHGIVFEMMDAMKQPSYYMNAYYFGETWSLFLFVPHSILSVLSWPIAIRTSDNVYGLLPLTDVKRASVWLMVIHQLAAFTYYVVPLVFYWEKLIGTHTRPWFIRLPSRLPVGLLIWFVGVAFPFYGSINSLFSSISTPFTAFALPALAFNWVYRNKALREDAVKKPPGWTRPWGNYWGIYVFNTIVTVAYTAFGITAIVFSVKEIVANSKTFGVFAECHQCPKTVPRLF